MGLIDQVLGGANTLTAAGNAVQGVAEVFTANATKQMELSNAAYTTAMGETSDEFQTAGTGKFDRFVNGLNRLPRPMLALGTLALFIYAMIAPVSFTQRMVGLGYVPDPLWWLLGAIVSFYFGAREAHYFRVGRALAPQLTAAASDAATPAPPPAVPPHDDSNAALDDWRGQHNR